MIKKREWAYIRKLLERRPGPVSPHLAGGAGFLAASLVALARTPVGAWAQKVMLKTGHTRGVGVAGKCVPGATQLEPVTTSS